MIMRSMNSALSLCRPHCAPAGVSRQPQRHCLPKRQEKQEWDTMGHNGTEFENPCPNAVPQIGNNANFRAKWDNMGIYGNAWEKFRPLFPAQTPDPPHVRPSRIAALDSLRRHRIPPAKSDSPEVFGSTPCAIVKNGAYFRTECFLVVLARRPHPFPSRTR